MATPVKLNTTTSITDYLKSINKPTDLSSRTSLFKSSGLEDRLGKYVGSASQNVALLKSLQTPTVEQKPLISGLGGYSLPVPSTEKPVDFTKMGMNAPQEYNAGFPLKPTNKPVDFSQTNVNKAQATPTTLASKSTEKIDWSKINLAPPIDWSKLSLSTPSSATQALSTAQGGSQGGNMGGTQGGGTQTDTSFQDSQTESTKSNAPAFGDGGTPTPEDFGIGLPSEAELVQQYLDSSEYNALKGAQDIKALGAALDAETARENLQAKYEADKQEVEQLLGSRGLWFSGIRNTQVAALAQSLAMSMNQLDRKTAQALLESDAQFKQDVLKGIEELFTEAKNDNKDAIKQLNEAGFVMIGNQILPSLAAQRFQSDEENRKQTQQMALLSFQQKLNEFDALQQQRNTINQISVKKLQISMQNANTSQERNAILNQMKQIQLMNLTAVSPGQIINAATGLPVKLTSEQQAKFSGFSSMLDTQIPAITSLLDKVGTGAIAGRYMTFSIDKPALQNTLSNDQQALIQTMNQMNNSLIYLLSGKQINQAEFERLKLQLPSLNYSNDQNTQQISSFSNTLKDLQNKELGAMGWTVAGSNAGAAATNNLIISEAMGGDSLDDIAAEFEE